VSGDGRRGVRARWRALDRAGRAVGGFVVLGLAVRVVWVIAVARTPPGFNDPVEYLRLGLSIAHGHGYTSDAGFPTAYYPVGYPAFIAVVAWPVLHSPLRDHVAPVVELVQALLSAATVLAMAVVAWSVIGRRAAVATAAVLALWPNLVFHTGVLLSETLFNALVAAVLVTLLVVADDPSGARWPASLTTKRLVGAGVLLALAALVRSTALLALPVLLIVALVARVPRRRALVVTGVVTLTTIVVLAPWTIRNAVRMHAFVPISTNIGDDLCLGRYPGATGWFAVTPYCQGNPDVAPQDVEVARDHRNTRQAIHWAVHDPYREVRLAGWRFSYTYTSDHDALFAADAYGTAPQVDAGTADVLGRVADDYFFVALVLAVAGAGVFVRDGGGRAWFVVVLGVAFALAPLAFFGDSRFHVPAILFAALPAAVVLERVPPVLASARAGRATRDATA